MIHKIPVSFELQIESDEPEGSLIFTDHIVSEVFTGDLNHRIGYDQKIGYNVDLTIYIIKKE